MSECPKDESEAHQNDCLLVTMPTLPQDAAPASARDWLPLLMRYRGTDQVRSLLELAVTAIPFVALWVLAWLALSVGYWLTLLVALPAAGFLVRLFMIQHDCGHGAFFRRKASNDWTGRILGVLTLTPYHVWRRSHAAHHASSGSLDQRGMGDITTLTIREYRARSWLGRLGYRLYRNPLVLFGLGPAYLFLLRNRFPTGTRHGDWRLWASAFGTNAALLAAGGCMVWLTGASAFLMVHVPIVLLAASIGVWLFYIQHQFEDTYWARGGRWQMHEAALHGSSHYDLPQPLRWMTANIGMHHVHHLCSGIPYYRLPLVLRDYPELADMHRLTLGQSLVCLRLRLWDEERLKLVSFREARENPLRQPYASPPSA